MAYEFFRDEQQGTVVKCSNKECFHHNQLDGCKKKEIELDRMGCCVSKEYLHRGKNERA